MLGAFGLFCWIAGAALLVRGLCCLERFGRPGVVLAFVLLVPLMLWWGGVGLFLLER
jgi:hypothetical protein